MATKKITLNELRSLVKKIIKEEKEVNYSEEKFILYQIDEIRGKVPVIIDISSLVRFNELSELGNSLIKDNKSKEIFMKLYNIGELQDNGLIDLH
jgi:hypothetical protein